MDEAPPPMSLIAAAALGGALALASLLFAVTSEPTDGPTPTPAPVEPPAPPPPAPEPAADAGARRISVTPLTYIGETVILDEAIVDGREAFEPCWTRAGGADGIYRVTARLVSSRDGAESELIQVSPSPGVDPHVCIGALLTPRPGHDSLFDGSFNLRIAFQ